VVFPIFLGVIAFFSHLLLVCPQTATPKQAFWRGARLVGQR
jgi:hypothetical protein